MWQLSRGHAIHSLWERQAILQRKQTDTPAPEGANPQTSEEAIKDPTKDSVTPEPTSESEGNDSFLESIDFSFCSSDVVGPPISDKIATITNEKFRADLGFKNRKEILEKYSVP